MGIADELEKAIGSNDEHAQVETWLDTGFMPLNYAISGDYDKGMPAGRIVEMFGPESSGKTAIATSVMASAQRAGGIAGFMDHERSFQSPHAIGLGLDLDPNKFVFKTPRTFEESINVSIKVASLVREKKLIDPKAPIVFVYDSLASMIPRSKAEKSVDEYSMHDNTALARATAAVFPAFAQFCEEHQMLALVLNQIRTKPGVVYGDPTTTPGGESPKFYSSVRIQLGRQQIKDKDKVHVGQQIKANVIKNKVSRPFQTAAWDFRFRVDGSGYFDVIGSTVDYLTDKEILKKSGARITWIDGKSYFKAQLVEKIQTEGSLEELKAIVRAGEAIVASAA
jgi:recombination protein RecA